MKVLLEASRLAVLAAAIEIHEDKKMNKKNSVIIIRLFAIIYQHNYLMNFNYDRFRKKSLEKYSRQIIMDKIGLDGQKKLMKTSICIIGCGGQEQLLLNTLL